MPLTSAERSRRWREKKKANDADYKKKERERQVKIRKEIKLSRKSMKKKRRQDRLRSRRYEQRKKDAFTGNLVLANNQSQMSSGEGSQYSNKASKMKAIYRASRALQSGLPNEPVKQKEVVESIALSFGVNVKTTQPAATTTVAEKMAVDFLNLDDISRAAPGMRDLVIVKGRDGGSKEMRPKRHLLLTLREAHQLFLKEHDDVEMGFSTFAKTRSTLCPEILLSEDIPHECCLCYIHENFINLVNSIANLDSQLPRYHSAFVENEITLQGSDSHHFQCPVQACEVYLNATSLLEKYTDAQKRQPHGMMKYSKWAIMDNGRFGKTTFHMPLAEAIDEVRNQVKRFVIHHQTKRQQALAYRTCKVNATAEVPVMQIDFAENYTCDHQDEVQSAYYSKKQISVFTCCIWKGEGQSMKQSVILSDSLEHNRITVCVYIMELMERLEKEVKQLHIWSDGPASQFKNCYMAAFLQHVCMSRFPKIDSIDWHFFPTAHGKGPCDALGGSVKRMARRTVMTRRAPIQSANEMATALSSSNVEAIVVNDAHKRYEQAELDRVLGSVRKIPGISGDHHWHVNKKEMKRSPTSVVNKACQAEFELVEVPCELDGVVGRPVGKRPYLESVPVEPPCGGAVMEQTKEREKHTSKRKRCAPTCLKDFMT